MPSSEQFYSGPYFGPVNGRPSLVALLLLAGLLCFCGSASAETAPGEGELRYDLPVAGTGATQTKPLPKTEENSVSPQAIWGAEAREKEDKPLPAPKPRQTSPVYSSPPSPEAKSASPLPVTKSVPPTPAPAPPPRQYSNSTEAKEIVYPLQNGRQAAHGGREGTLAPSPTPLPAEGEKGQETLSPGDVARYNKSSTNDLPLWAREAKAAREESAASGAAAAPERRSHVKAESTPQKENVTRAQEAEQKAAITAKPEPTPEPEQAQLSPEQEVYREQGAGMTEVTRNYPGYNKIQGEDIGYGVVDAPAPRALSVKSTEEAAPPAVKTHVRTAEERGQTQEDQRDERVPADIGPYAWVPASEASPQDSGDSKELPWELSADKVTSYNQNSVVDAEGEVFLHRGREYIKADFGRYFADTGWAYLKGNVQVYFGTDRLSGEEAEFDLANKVGWVKNGQVFMSGPHVYLKGERVNKNWGDTYTFRNAKITTCDGPVPAWSIYAEDAVVELDGYARLWGSSLAIKDHKIAYTPYMVVPAKRDRQSGFLVPHAGQDRRKGFYWNQPYFWAIDESRDMTLNSYIMTDRGVMLGAEYRSKQEWDENLWLRADYLHDSVTWDKRGDNYFNQSYLRTNSDRYWLRGMYNGTPFADRRWKVKGNLDYVSDAYFLREFKNDPQGFDSTRNYLEDSFGRTLAPWSSNRISEGVVYRDWDRFTLSAGMRYEQNPYLDNGNTPRSKDTIAQKLPDINMYLHKGRIWENMPVEAEGEAQAVYFYRREGSKGTRYDLNPKLSVPLRNEYGSLVPEVALRGSLYQTGDEGRIVGDTGNSTDNSRFMPEFSLAGFTELARNYSFDSAPLTLSEKNVGDRRWSGMRHTIQPRVEYSKRWDVDQDDLPYFDTIDRLPPQDQIVYSLTNLLTVRRESVGMDKNSKPVVRDDYIDFLRFKLETGYDFDEARRNWRTDAYKRRPFMDILADITVAPGSWFSINSRTWWSPYNAEFTRMDNNIKVWEPAIGSLAVGLDSRRQPDEYKRWSSSVLYRDLSLLHRGLITEDDIRINRYRKPVDLLYTDMQLSYFAPFTFSWQQWYDLRGNESQETHLSVIYTHQCYQLEAYFWKDTHDESYGLSLSLPGFWN